MSKWDDRWLEVAQLYSSWSKDPSTKVGCVVINQITNRQRSMGYNGLPRGVDDTEERYNDRNTKLALTAHAEENALYTAASEGTSLMGCTMYVTFPPCNRCMIGIIQSGIARVVWSSDSKFETDPETNSRWAESMKVSRLMAYEAGILMGPNRKEKG